MQTVSPVRLQYEELPYPPRDPARELEELHTTVLAQLKLLDVALWGGSRRPLRAPFRCLDAGCGTGDSAIFLAEQLRDTKAEVVALDLSEASLEVARQRAARRELTNITFVRAPIEEIASLGVGSFDYIVSAGVLHHLPSPEAGLAALAAVLNDGAAMGLMLYGRYGRLDVYQLQDLFRQLAPPTLPTDERLAIVKSVLRRLGPDHWGNLAGSLWKTEVKAAGDAGLFDLFLHSTDRAYTVPEVHDFLASAGLRLARFDVPILYDPRLNWPNLDLSRKSEPELQAIAEALHGRMKKHTFFAVPVATALPPAPSPSDLDAIPVWLLHDPALILRQADARPQIDLLYEGMDFHCTLDLFRREFLRQIDGARSTGQILECIAPRLPKYDHAALRSAWFNLHEALSMFNVLGLTGAAA